MKSFGCLNFLLITLLLIIALWSTAFGKRIHSKYVNFVQTEAYKRLLETRLVGAETAAVGSAPYQVSLQTTWGTPYCGGVILDDKTILTAAHCVTDYGIEFLRVIVGTNRFREPGATHEILRYVTHCRHDLPEYQNDIAVVFLKVRLTFNELVQPIRLATELPKTGDTLVITGWGDLRLNGETPDDLQRLEVKYVPHEECLKLWNYDEGVGPGHVCTFVGAGYGACNGDSGGPVVFNGTLLGLVNWGAPCALGKPDMHASVVYYRDFIELAKSDCARLRG